MEKIFANCEQSRKLKIKVSLSSQTLFPSKISKIMCLKSFKFLRERVR